jgi:hypothetical protein
MQVKSIGRRPGPVDRAVVAAIRTVADASLAADAAADRLRRQVPDPRVLRRARGRLAGALVRQRSPLAERAAATLSAALDVVPVPDQERPA